MAGFSIVFLFGQLTTPITYYFSRYLVSEIVPLACICAAVALERVRLSLPKGGWYLFPLYGACVLYSVWTPIVSRMSATEGEGITRAVECLDQITGSNGVLLLDRQGLAFGAYAYATPLKLGFGKRIFTVVRNDFVGEPAKLDALVSYFERRNLEVFLVSSHTTWQGHSGLQRVLTLPITQRLLLAQRRLPSRFWKRSRTITVYAKRADLPMPGVCARMVQER
jgi:hypothetical protein